MNVVLFGAQNRGCMVFDGYRQFSSIGHICCVRSARHHQKCQSQVGASSVSSGQPSDRSHAVGGFIEPIVTQIVPAVTFYEAEDYHQQYLEKKGLASCHIKA